MSKGRKSKAVDPKRMTLVQAARRAKVSRQRLIQAIKAGSLKGRQEPVPQWLVDWQDVVDYIDRTGRINRQTKRKPNIAP